MKKQVLRVSVLILIVTEAFGQSGSSSTSDFLSTLKRMLEAYLLALFRTVANIFQSLRELFSIYVYPLLEKLFYLLGSIMKSYLSILKEAIEVMFDIFGIIIHNSVSFINEPSQNIFVFVLKLIPILLLIGVIVAPVNLATKPLFIHSIREIKYYMGRLGKRFVALSTFFFTVALLATAADGLLFYYMLKEFSPEGEATFTVLLSVVIPLIMALAVDAILVQVGGIYLKAYFYFLFHMHDEWEEFLHRIQMANHRKMAIVPFTRIIRFTSEKEKRHSFVDWLGAIFSISIGLGFFMLVLLLLMAWGSSRKTGEDLVYVLLGSENYFLSMIFAVFLIFIGMLMLFLVGSEKGREKLSNMLEKFFPEGRMNILGVISTIGLITLFALLIVVFVKWLPDFLNYVVGGIFRLAPVKGVRYTFIEGVLFYLTLALLGLAAIVFSYILYRTHTLFETFNEKFFGILTSLFFVLVILGALLANSVRGDFMEYADLKRKEQHITNQLENKKYELIKKYIVYDAAGNIDYEKTMLNVDSLKAGTRKQQVMASLILDYLSKKSELNAVRANIQRTWEKVRIPFNLGLAFITSALAYVAGVSLYLAVHILGGGLSFYILLLLGFLRMFTFLAAFPIALISIGPIVVAFAGAAFAWLFFQLFYSVLLVRKLMSERLNNFRKEKFTEGFIDGMYIYLEDKKK